MTVKELKRVVNALSEKLDDAQVIVQLNLQTYSPLEGIDEFTVYVPETDKQGDVIPEHWMPGEMGMTETEWVDVKKTADKCIVLFSKLQ